MMFFYAVFFFTFYGGVIPSVGGALGSAGDVSVGGTLSVGIVSGGVLTSLAGGVGLTGSVIDGVVLVAVSGGVLISVGVLSVLDAFSVGVVVAVVSSVVVAEVSIVFEGVVVATAGVVSPHFPGTDMSAPLDIFIQYGLPVTSSKIVIPVPFVDVPTVILSTSTFFAVIRPSSSIDQLPLADARDLML
jgi:hypothetical protein